MKGSYLVIMFLAIALVISLTLVYRTTIYVGQATGSSTSIAFENSYLFASPLQAKADNKETIRINVFILDSRGVGIPGKETTLRTEKILSIKSIQSITDDSGKAVFDITSPSIGQYQVEALSDSHQLPQKVKISFY